MGAATCLQNSDGLQTTGSFLCRFSLALGPYQGWNSLELWPVISRRLVLGSAVAHRCLTVIFTSDYTCCGNTIPQALGLVCRCSRGRATVTPSCECATVFVHGCLAGRLHMSIASMFVMAAIPVPACTPHGSSTHQPSASSLGTIPPLLAHCYFPAASLLRCYTMQSRYMAKTHESTGNTRKPRNVGLCSKLVALARLHVSVPSRHKVPPDLCTCACVCSADDFLGSCDGFPPEAALQCAASLTQYMSFC
jgi:hypothetical protein